MQSVAPFAITDQARKKIESMTRQYEARINKKPIVAIMWIDSTRNRGLLQSQPAIGFYNDRSEIETDITIIDGLEFVLAVSEEDKEHFIGKTLDHDGSRFIIR